MSTLALRLLPAVFCLLLFHSPIAPLRVTYQPRDNDVLLCSVKYILFVGSNFTVTVALDQSGPFTFTSSHSGGNVETRSYTGDGISPIVINQVLADAGTYNITVTSTGEGIWQKEIRVTDLQDEIQDASVAQTSVMPGELLSGQVDKSVVGVRNVHYVWYVRKKMNMNNNAQPPWQLIQAGSQMTVQFNSTGVYELLVSKSNWQSPCRKIWIIYVYVTKPTFAFGPLSSIPVKGRSRDVTCTVYNNSQSGDVIWKYEGQEVAACRGRSRVARKQSFMCHLQMIDFVKHLQVRFEPDDVSQLTRVASMYPIAKFEIWPRYAQAGSYTQFHIRNYGNESWWTLGSANHVKRIWRDVRLSDGVSRRDVEAWSAYYRISNSAGGADSITVDLYNQISHVEKVILVRVVDTNNFQIRSSYGDGVVFTRETVVPMGERVSFTIIDNHVTDDVQYIWDIPVLTKASLITPTEDHHKREFIFNNDVINANPTPWSFIFKITPRLGGAPSGVETTRLVTVHVYKAITDVKLAVLPHLLRSALVVRSQYQFKVVWSGSEGSCRLRSPGDSVDDTSQVSSVVDTTGSEINVTTDSNFHHCLISMRALSEPTTSTSGPQVVKLEVWNRLNVRNFTRSFTVFKYVDHLNVTRHDQIALNQTYRFIVENWVPDTEYSWYLVNNRTGASLLLGNNGSLDFKFPSSGLEIGYYRVLLDALGPLFVGGNHSVSYATKVVREDITAAIEPAVVLHPDVNTTLFMSVGDPIQDAVYTWYLFNSTLKVFEKLGEGVNLTSVLPVSIGEGIHNVKVHIVCPE